jgi:hypothetical protein
MEQPKRQRVKSKAMMPVRNIMAPPWYIQNVFRFHGWRNFIRCFGFGDKKSFLFVTTRKGRIGLFTPNSFYIVTLSTKDKQ